MIFTVLLVLLITTAAIVTGLAVPGVQSYPSVLASATTSARIPEHFGSKFCNAACASVAAKLPSTTRLSKRLNSEQVAFVVGGTAIGAGLLIIILLFVAIYAVRRRPLRLEKLGSSQARTSGTKDKGKTKAHSLDNRRKHDQPTRQEDTCIWGPPSPPPSNPYTAWQTKETTATLSNPPAPRPATQSRPSKPNADRPMAHAAATCGLVGSNIRPPPPAALPPPRNPNRERKQNKAAVQPLVEGPTTRQTPKSLPPLMTQLPTSPSQVEPALFGPPRSGSTSRPRYQHRLSVSPQTATLADDSRWSMSTLGMELLSDTMKSPQPARYSYAVSPESPESDGSCAGRGELARRRSGNNKGGRGRGTAGAAAAEVQSPWRADCEEQLVGPGTRWKSVWTIYEDDGERPQSCRSEKK